MRWHRFLITIIKKIGYVIAVSIILAALLISIARLVTPVLDAHRQDFEKWASQLLGAPVEIETVRVSWYQYQPEITLNQVTILNPTSKHPVLQLNTIRVFFSLLQSIWQHKFILSSVMISGVEVNLHQTKTGEISVQGFPSLGGLNSQPYQNETKFADIMAWLSVQPRIVLHNIDIRYTPFTGPKRYVTLYNLNFDNENEKHTLFGKAVLHQDIPTEVSIAVQWQGQGVDLAKINAKLYLYISGFSISQWLKEKVWNGWQVKQGLLSAKTWLTWSDGRFQKIQTEFQAYNLDLYSAKDKSQHTINRLSGEIGWKREGNNQIIAGQDILLDLPAHLWPVTNFYASFAPDETSKLVPKII